MLTAKVTNNDAMMRVNLRKGKEKEEDQEEEGGGKFGVQAPEPSSCCCFVGQHYISRFVEKPGNHFST